MARQRIMIVEDEAINAVGLQIALKKLGYHICPLYSSAEQALTEFEQEKPDLVIMDIHLSGKLNGIEAAGLIRKQSKTPIIFLTGYSDKDTFDRISKIHGAACVTKPTDPDKIEQVLQNFLTHPV